jgi:hypothetical protein
MIFIDHSSGQHNMTTTFERGTLWRDLLMPVYGFIDFIFVSSIRTVFVFF